MQRRMARRLVESPGIVGPSTGTTSGFRVTRQADLSVRLLGRPFFVPPVESENPRFRRTL